MVDNSIPQMGTTIQGIPTGSQPAPAGNPLAKHLRQPKIYLRLPSGGAYWPAGSLEQTDNGEYPVYAMTAKDEITFKTPDALLNGQATVDVIQNCIPNIKDAWQTPSIDLDAILIAIRMASFGQSLDMTTKVPNTDLERDFTMNLQQMYDNILNIEYQDKFQIDGFTIQIKPLSYRSMTAQMVKAFEQQRIFSIVNDNTINDVEKMDKFQESFSKLTDLNISVVIESIVAIQPDGEDSVTNPVHLEEFIKNVEAKVYNQITDHITKQREKFQQPPITVEATKEEIDAGAPKTFDIPVTFDQSNFFGSGS